MTNFYTTVIPTTDIAIFLVTVFVLAQFLNWLRLAFFNYVCDPNMMEYLRVKKPETQVKFRETTWFFGYYLWCVLLIITYLESNLRCWIQIGFHEDDTLCPTPLTLKLYFLSQCCFYLHALMTVFKEKRRKDFTVMVSHHIATVLVVGTGYIYGMWNAGGVIIGLHDLADVLLYGTKLLHYSKQSDWVTTATFVSFAVTFFVTRIILFPIVVYWHWTFSKYGILLSSFMYLLQLALYVMHIYWFSLIVRMIKRTIFAKKVEQDIRSDDEDED